MKKLSREVSFRVVNKQDDPEKEAISFIANALMNMKPNTPLHFDDEGDGRYTNVTRPGKNKWKVSFRPIGDNNDRRQYYANATDTAVAIYFKEHNQQETVEAFTPDDEFIRNFNEYINNLRKTAFDNKTDRTARFRAQAELEDMTDGHWDGHRTDDPPVHW
jgi:hypothetical protein